MTENFFAGGPPMMVVVLAYAVIAIVMLVINAARYDVATTIFRLYGTKKYAYDVLRARTDLLLSLVWPALFLRYIVRAIRSFRQTGDDVRDYLGL